MGQKNKDSMNEQINFYENYFKEELDAIEEELKKSKEYSTIIDREVERLSMPTLGTNKGSQHYLIEHITNAVQLQTQRQGLRRDKFTIKKAIIDYASKFADENAAEGDNKVAELLNELLERDKEKNKEKVEIAEVNNSDLDAEIDRQLNGGV